MLRRGFAEFTPSEGVAEEGILLTPSEGVKKKRLSWEVLDDTTAVRGKEVTVGGGRAGATAARG